MTKVSLSCWINSKPHLISVGLRFHHGSVITSYGQHFHVVIKSAGAVLRLASRVTGWCRWKGWLHS